MFLKNLIKNSKNIIILCGAGISVASGIPDFRSSNNGIYSNLEKISQEINEKPTFVFDINIFKKDPKPFWWIFTKIWPQNFWPKPTTIHYLFSLLNEEGKLNKIYTQNTDYLEYLSGIPNSKIVYSHGILNPCHCLNCNKEISLNYCMEKIKPNLNNLNLNFKDFIVPICPNCNSNQIKPDVVFFGEDNPKQFYENINQDFENCDLLLIVGTSLQVNPFADLIYKVNLNVPRILINLNPVKEKNINDPNGFDFLNNRDFFIQGDCQEFALNFINEMNWNDKFSNLKEITKDLINPLTI